MLGAYAFPQGPVPATEATYLNVYVHWLWRLGEDPLTGQAMDLGNRVPGAGDSFEDEEQWTAAVEKVVLRAVEEVRRYRALVPDLAAASPRTGSGRASGSGWCGPTIRVSSARCWTA